MVVCTELRSVIIEDLSIEGAPEETIRKRHLDWVNRHGFNILTSPHMNYHLVMDDRSVRSILASAEPGQLGMVGYVNVLDAEYEYEPEDPDDNTSEYYHWSVRLNFDHLLRFVLSFQDVGEQAWGSCSIESPDDVLYTDGHGFAVRDKTVFLCPLDDGVHGLFENNIAEFQYLESLE